MTEQETKPVPVQQQQEEAASEFDPVEEVRKSILIWSNIVINLTCMFYRFHNRF